MKKKPDLITWLQVLDTLDANPKTAFVKVEVLGAPPGTHIHIDGPESPVGEVLHVNSEGYTVIRVPASTIREYAQDKVWGRYQDIRSKRR